MPADTIPRDPVYMTYITSHYPEVTTPSPPRGPGSPYRPASGMTHTEVQLRASKGVYQHFHRPANDHNRFMTAASTEDIAALRTSPRVAPPPWDGSTAEYDLASSRRPSSAPGRGGAGAGLSPEQRAALGSATLLDNMTTQTGRPCYTVCSILEADLQAGAPVLEPEERQPGDWRVARVQTYQVPPSRTGYGEGGVRPFHQDYRHYKYYGFAGHGAKTSWAHNPKYSRIYADIFTSASDSTSPASSTDRGEVPPLHAGVGGPRRPLTAAERSLVGQFRWHNYPMEGTPSDPAVAALLGDVAAGVPPDPEVMRRLHVPVQGTRPSTAGSTAGGGGAKARRRPASAGSGAGPGPGPAGWSMAHAAVIEPFNARVDIEDRTPLWPGHGPDAEPHGPHSHPPASPGSAGPHGHGHGHRAARVTTYRQVASPYAGELNRSPNHGSQSPWHQRYSHYKNAGFAGRGATSSWARNPKYAALND